MSQTKAQLIEGLNVNTSAPADSLVIDSSGNVGLGSSSPGANLHIRKDQAAFTGIYLDNRNTSAGSYSGISFGTNASGTNQWFITRENQTTANLDFALTLGSPTLSLTPAGQVGIGTTSPTNLLDLESSSNLSLDITKVGTDTLRAGIDSSGPFVRAGTHIAFRSGGDSEVGRWDSSGRLLVGTSSGRGVGESLQATIQIETVGNSPSLSIVNNNNSIASPSLKLGKTRGTSNGSNTIVQSGDVLGSIIFAGADGVDLETPGAYIFAQVDGTPGANDMPGRLVFSTTADGASSPTERMIIKNNGNVNWTSTGASIPTNNVTGTTVFGTNGALGGSRGDGGQYFTFYNFSNSTEIGSIANNAGTSILYNTTSDYRLKENSIALSDGIERVKLLNPLRFNFIANPEITVDGFFAHEVQDVVPEAISGQKDAVNEDGSIKPQGIDQSKLVPLLTAALQEAIAKIEILEQRLNDAGIA